MSKGSIFFLLKYSFQGNLLPFDVFYSSQFFFCSSQGISSSSLHSAELKWTFALVTPKFNILSSNTSNQTNSMQPAKSQSLFWTQPCCSDSETWFGSAVAQWDPSLWPCIPSSEISHEMLLQPAATGIGRCRKSCCGLQCSWTSWFKEGKDHVKVK